MSDFNYLEGIFEKHLQQLLQQAPTLLFQPLKLRKI